MEVHHHAHTPRKKWTHYFWEFFMLFLAVTLGFFVENQREHYVEHLRAKQYAESLTEDLKNDTVTFGNLKNVYKRDIGRIDSLRSILKQKPISEISAGVLYYYCEPAIWASLITFHDATLQQLKNSGNLRYFSSKLQYQISEYDRKAREISARQENEIYFSRISREMMTDIFDAEQIIEVYGLSTNEQVENFKKGSVKLLTRDTTKIRKLLNEIIYRHASWQFRLRDIIEPSYRAAIELLAAIKKEYHLE
jgi:hypothetical protein